jgi:shikimate dehydrogenase
MIATAYGLLSDCRRLPMTAPVLAGLIGYPTGHSLSPRMQQAAFDALGIPARYELWETPPEALADRIAALRAPGILGANVTIPHKTAVLPLLDTIDPDALRHAGAVNTIVREQTPTGVRLAGHNTDVAALRRVLHEHGDSAPGRRMLVLGAGGAAQAALGAALLEGLEPWVAARRLPSAREALDALWRRTRLEQPADRPCPSAWLDRALTLDDADRLYNVVATTQVLINATPVGTRDPDASLLPANLLAQLPPGAFVFDMVYNPPATALVRAARARGLAASGGLPMLLYQGAAAFTLWTGRPAPLDVMRAALMAEE